MNKEKFFLGYNHNFHDLCYIYPPKVKDVVNIPEYSIYVKMLTTSQEEIEDEWVENGHDMSTLLTPLEYILNNAYHSKEFLNLLKKAFLFFTQEDITLLFEQKMIIIGDVKQKLRNFKNLKSLKDIPSINEDNFFEFQNMVRMAIGSKTVEPPNPDEDPRIKKIKAKARYRDKVKAKQGLGLNLKSILGIICCMEMGLNPLNIGELSYCAVSPLMEIYQSKEKYHQDVDSLIGGADRKKIKPVYWIKNYD